MKDCFRSNTAWKGRPGHDFGIAFEVYKDESDSSLKLIDFGFAKAFAEDKPMTATLGTIYYMAPEVIRGSYNHKCGPTTWRTRSKRLETPGKRPEIP